MWSKYKNLHIIIINISITNCYMFDSQFLPNLTGTTGEQESTNWNNLPVPA